MATWQFDVHLIPRSELQNVFGFIPERLDREAFNETNWWQNTPLPHKYQEMLSAFVFLGASWSDKIELWGEENGDRIELFEDGDQLDGIHIRINVADLDARFITGVVNFAQTCECVLLVNREELIEPDSEILFQSVLSSGAARFVANPREFFERLRANGIED